MKEFVAKNATLLSVTLFIILFGLLITIKPKFLYNSDGSIREFGIGYKNKTIMPIWIFSILLGILSYWLVLVYLAYS